VKEYERQPGAGGHRKRFNGKEDDVASGLRYYGFRSYDPVTLRWVSSDPLLRMRPEVGQVEVGHLNLYAFSLGNPVRFYDPDGRKTEQEQLDDEPACQKKCEIVSDSFLNDNAKPSNGNLVYSHSRYVKLPNNRVLPYDFYVAPEVGSTDGTSTSKVGEDGGIPTGAIVGGEPDGEPDGQTDTEMGPLSLVRGIIKKVTGRTYNRDMMRAIDGFLIVSAAAGPLFAAGLRAGVGALFRGSAAGGLARGGAGVVRVGQAGEAAVRAAVDIGPKTAIQIAGRTRIPDGLTSTVLSEVKNVGSLSYTQQLRDFAAYAGQNGLRFDLWVRPTTQLSGPLADEVARGAINLRFIP
jgi:RHS repeat-associated protein